MVMGRDEEERKVKREMMATAAMMGLPPSASENVQ